MSHFAEIDADSNVLRVLVCDNNDPTGDEGHQWLIDTFGGTWVKTSYNGNIRKNFAGTGYTYDSTRDAFIPPKPYESWLLNEDTCRWDAPTPMPEEGGPWIWSEDALNWISPVA